MDGIIFKSDFGRRTSSRTAVGPDRFRDVHLFDSDDDKGGRRETGARKQDEIEVGMMKMKKEGRAGVRDDPRKVYAVVWKQGFLN